MRYAAALALTLAACAAPPPSGPITGAEAAAYRPIDYDPPLAIRVLLPRGVTAAALRERDGCYAYDWQGTLYPVRRPDGGQYCIG